MSSTRKKRKSKKNRHKETYDEMSMMPSDGSFNEREDLSFSSGGYQVGEIDENGFVNIGITEKQVDRRDNMNKTFAGYTSSGFSSSGGYSSSEGYSSERSSSSRGSKHRISAKYKKSFDYLVE